MDKKLKLCPFCLGEAIAVYSTGDGHFTHVTCGNHKCNFGSVLTIEEWNFRPVIREEQKYRMNLPLSKDDYQPERTDIRDRSGFTIAENVCQKDADFIIKCCNGYDEVEIEEKNDEV